jgi:hypothetical protein
MIKPVAQHDDWLRPVAAGDQRRSGGARFHECVRDAITLYPSRQTSAALESIAPFGGFQRFMLRRNYAENVILIERNLQKTMRHCSGKSPSNSDSIKDKTGGSAVTKIRISKPRRSHS